MKPKTRRLAAAWLFAAALRIGFILLSSGNYDTDSYRIVTETVHAGKNLYATGRYNYTPAWALALLGCEAIGQFVGIEFLHIVGFLLLIVDAVSAYLVSRLVAARDPARAGLAALLFFANPLNGLVAGYQVQFDGVAVLFLLAAISAADRPRAGPIKPSLLLTLSLAFKHIAWFHPLLFARRAGRRSMLWFALPYAVFLLSFAPYAADLRQIRAQVFQHRGLTFNYGIEALMLIGFPERGLTILFVCAALAAVVLLKPAEDLARNCLRLFLVVLIAMPGFSAQYCLWPIALGCVVRPNAGLIVYTVVASGFFLRGPLLGSVAPWWLPGWYGPWFAAILWLLLDLRATENSPPVDYRGEPV